jgi:NarL family two-component system response regulator LiaR
MILEKINSTGTGAPNFHAGATSVVLSYPYGLVCEGVRRILSEAGFRVSGQADSISDLCQIAMRTKPDLVLVDWERARDQLNKIRDLAQSLPKTYIAALVPPGTAAVPLQGLEAGIKGYLSLNLMVENFVQALKMLAQGDIIISRDVVNSMRLNWGSNQSPKWNDGLSDREREVLGLVGKGATNREIAEKLIISEHTVKVHLRTILNKLNLQNRQQAAAYAAKEGLLKESEKDIDRVLVGQFS